MPESISIITATVGRLEQVERLLTSLSRLDGYNEFQPELIVANNAPDDAQASRIERLVADFARKLPHPCRHVREPRPGKCRAQNRAIPMARGTLLVFLDDDVEVASDWLRSIVRFFDSFPHEVMQGSILMRDRDRKDPQILKALHRYRTIDYIDYGSPPGSELFTLTGGNMAIRRAVFDKVGFFNEKLGPGQGGISEDVEFAKRVVAAGMKIGYEPRAAVYNEMDRSRLTETEFRRRHEAQGRSRFAYKHQSSARIMANVFRSMMTFAWFSLTGNERRKYRAKGRYYHYRAMFVERTRSKAESQG